MRKGRHSVGRHVRGAGASPRVLASLTLALMAATLAIPAAAGYYSGGPDNEAGKMMTAEYWNNQVVSGRADCVRTDLATPGTPYVPAGPGTTEIRYETVVGFSATTYALSYGLVSGEVAAFGEEGPAVGMILCQEGHAVDPGAGSTTTSTGDVYWLWCYSKKAPWGWFQPRCATVPPADWDALVAPTYRKYVMAMSVATNEYLYTVSPTPVYSDYPGVTTTSSTTTISTTTTIVLPPEESTTTVTDPSTSTTSTETTTDTVPEDPGGTVPEPDDDQDEDAPSCEVPPE